jgi:uncharacterized protein (TIGR03083 family)
MSTEADQMIDVLRSEHDSLATLVESLSADDIVHASGAAKWTVAQVLSHLGSGAEIMLATLDAALTGTDNRTPDFNAGVWARWDAKPATEQAADSITANQALLERLEAIDAETRVELRIDLGFLPAPVDLATAAGLRLNEVAYHVWDVKVGFDPSATVSVAAANLLIDRAGMLLGFISHADALVSRPVLLSVRTTDPERSIGLSISDSVSLLDAPAPAAADAELTAPAEAWLRLTVGRLAPEHTPAEVNLSGGTGQPVSLDDLRRVFPGF